MNSLSFFSSITKMYGSPSASTVFLYHSLSFCAVDLQNPSRFVLQSGRYIEMGYSSSSNNAQFSADWNNIRIVLSHNSRFLIILYRSKESLSGSVFIIRSAITEIFSVLFPTYDTILSFTTLVAALTSTKSSCTAFAFAVIAISNDCW